MPKNKLPVPEKTGKKWFKSLAPEQKRAALEPYLAAELSNTEIATLLKISEGSVANARHKRNMRLHPERYIDGRPRAKVEAENAKQQPAKKKPTRETLVIPSAVVTTPAPIAPLKMFEEDIAAHWLRFYRNLGLLTQSEAGSLLGRPEAEVKDICDRYNIVSWRAVSDEVKHKRTCCLPLTARQEVRVVLCCAPTSPDDGFVCTAHAESKIPLR
jgi:hypothetical protein